MNKIPFAKLTTKTTKNLGDEIQIIAANRFIESKIDGSVDRESLSVYTGLQKRLLMNGWYLNSTEYWPPSSKLRPLITSFHMTDLPDVFTDKPVREILTKQKNNKNFLVSNGPIGARDTETYRYLLEQGIPSYFSGCLTLTLKPSNIKKQPFVCCIDVSNAVEQKVKKLTNNPIVHLENSTIPDYKDYDAKLQIAQDTLNTYEEASVVVTTRLHAALPCLALGTPVILINNKNIDNSRYLGLKDLVRNCDEEEFVAGMYNDQVGSPVANDNYFVPIAKNLEKIVERFVSSDKKYIDYNKLSSENLLQVLIAKEKNEQNLRQFARSIKPRSARLNQLGRLFHKN